MKIIEKVEPFEDISPLILDIFTEDTLFFDIETTGFSAQNTMAYLIGCAYRTDKELHLCQYFAETGNDEISLIEAFLKLSDKFHRFITFHGTGFDIPYLKKRCGFLQIQENFDSFSNIDIYRLVCKVAHLLPLVGKKQKSVENFLGIKRDDLYDGGQLIEVFYDYLRTHDDENEKLLLLHNYEDVLGMTKTLSILSYYELFQDKSTCFDAYQNDSGEVIFSFRLPYPVPKQISKMGKECYLTCNKDTLKILVNVYSGQLYYFHSNYKEYFYLQEEDMAIHKSVAEFVDKKHRQKAKASNCYTKRQGVFLPLFAPLPFPCFLPAYKSKESYIELTQEFLNNKEQVRLYGNHLLNAFFDKSILL